jgi:hypothetical protein
MAAVAHLGLRFSRLWDRRRVPGEELMLNTKFVANRTNRIKSIRICFNFSFFRKRPSWIETKMTCLIIPVPGPWQEKGPC